jgi:hypothetical protein
MWVKQHAKPGVLIIVELINIENATHTVGNRPIAPVGRGHTGAAIIRYLLDHGGCKTRRSSFRRGSISHPPTYFDVSEGLNWYFTAKKKDKALLMLLQVEPRK